MRQTIRDMLPEVGEIANVFATSRRECASCTTSVVLFRVTAVVVLLAFLSAVLPVSAASAPQRKKQPRVVTPRENKKPSFASLAKSVFRVDTDSSVGTGFLFFNDQIVVTCYHVIKDASAITVVADNDIAIKVQSVVPRPDIDAAFLMLERPLSRPVLHPAKNKPSMGDRVYTIGTPLGILGNSLSDGLVSALRSANGVQLLQVTAPVSEGSSGSPVFDAGGKVIGMVSFTFTEGQALNMAVSTATILACKPDKGEFSISSQQAAYKPSAYTRSESAFIPLAALLDEFVMLDAIARDWRAKVADIEPARDRFVAFWDTFRASADGKALSAVERTTGTMDDIATYVVALDTYLAVLRKNEMNLAVVERCAIAHTALPSGFTEESTRLLDQEVEDYNALGEKWLKLSTQTLWHGTKAYISSPTYWTSFAVPVMTSFDAQVRDRRVTADPRWPRSCVLLQRLLPANCAELQKKHRDRELERFSNGIRKTYPMPEESLDAIAVAKRGWTIFAIRQAAGEWQYVTDWRSLANKVTKVLGDADSTNAELLVGPTRFAAAPIAVVLGYAKQ